MLKIKITKNNLKFFMEQSTNDSDESVTVFRSLTCRLIDVPMNDGPTLLKFAL